MSLPDGAGPRARDERLAVFLFAIAFCAYVASTAGIVGANAGSHYALVRAIGDEGRVSIDSHVEYTHHIDLARYGGRFYSNKPPATAFAALPLYGIGAAVGSLWPGLGFTVGHDPGRAAAVFAALLPALAGALTVAFVYGLARLLTAGTVAAFVAAVLAGFGTLLWRYAGALYHHSLSACALLALCTAAVAVRDLRRERWRAATLGVAAGLAITADYVNATVVPLVALYLVIAGKLRRPESRGDVATLASAVLGLAAPLVALAFYDAACFGSPFSTGYTYATSWDCGGRVVGGVSDPLPGFSTPLLRGLADLLFGGAKVDFPILRVSPLLAVAPLGIVLLWRRSRADAFLLTVVPTMLLCVMARFRVYWGGSVADTRYVLAALPLLCAPVALVVDWASARPGVGRRLVLTALVALALASFVGGVNAVATFEGHAFRELPRPASLALDAAIVFPSRRHLPLAFAVLVTAALLFRLCRRAAGFSGGVWVSPLAAAATVAMGVLCVAAATDGGPAALDEWESRVADAWNAGRLPLRGDGRRLGARTILRVPASGNVAPRLVLEATGCAATVSVNQVVRFQRDVCPTGAALPPFEVDTRGFTQPGPNRIELEIRGAAPGLVRAEIAP